MRSRQIGDGASLVAVLEPGEEVIATLTAFAADRRILAGSVTAIGAFADVVLGFFDFEAGDYHEIRVAEQVEVASLSGDLAVQDGRPRLHLHCVVSRRDGSTLGGHLLAAHVNPTLEVILREVPEPLHRISDPATGLALLRP